MVKLLRIVKTVLLIAAVLVAAGTRLLPPSWLSDHALPLLVVYSLGIARQAELAALVSLPVLAVALGVLAFLRRWRWIVRAAWVCAAVVVLFFIPIVVEAATLFYPGCFAALAVAAGAAFVAGRRFWPGRRVPGANALVNLLLAAAALSPPASQIDRLGDRALLANWRAATYFSAADVYDAAFAGPDRDLYIAAGYGGGVYRVRGWDYPQGVVGRALGIDRAERIALVGDRLVVSNNAVGKAGEPCGVSLSLPDLTDRRDIAIPGITQAIDVAADPATGRLFFIDHEVPRLAVWDAANHRLEKEIVLETGARISPHDVRFDPASRTLFVCCWLLGDFLYGIDADRLEVTARVPLGVSATDVEIDSARGIVYVARPLHARVDVFDLAGWRRHRPIRTVPGARQMAYVPEGNLLAVGSYFTGELEVIHLDDPSRRARIKAFPRLRGLAYDADGKRLIVSSRRGVHAIPLSAFDDPLRGGERP